MMTEKSSPTVNRRQVLQGVAGGAVGAMAGCSFFERNQDANTSEVDPERSASLAEQFAPALYFDKDEKWYPTDPRQWERERDGETVVSGFDAFEGYVNAGGAEDPPAPTVFYHAVEYDNSPLAVVQYWLYSAFDQFAANFHWHDWELLQVFVDTDSDEPQLFLASAHSRSAPNNEHLDPDPDRRPRVLSELGSHSSGLSVNNDPTRFQRLPRDGDEADITNSVIDGIEDIARIPLAYGLPRDEGLTLPYLIPELDGAPVYEHPKLPSVERSDMITDSLTIDSFQELQSPPSDLPPRETGLQFDYESREDSDADIRYALEPTSDAEYIKDFTGEQLSFPFYLPKFGEDIVSGHITTAGVPWDDPRYENPASDITETDHRQTLADRYDAIGQPSAANRVLASVTNMVSSDDAPDGEGLDTVSSPLELFALFQSDPRAVPTFQGVAAVQGPPEGEHTFTINGAGIAPHSETVTVTEDDAPDLAGVEGRVPVVANENATKLEVDPRASESPVNNFAVEDDFAGRIYDAPLEGPDAVYIHEGGAFTAEVRDADDEVGAARVNPDPSESPRLEQPETGKESLATYLADVAAETRVQVAEYADDDDDEDSPGNSGGGDGGPVLGLVQALQAIEDAADRAAAQASESNMANTDQQLDAVATRLATVAQRLEQARGQLPDEIGNAADKRLDQLNRRSEQARNSEKV